MAGPTFRFGLLAAAIVVVLWVMFLCVAWAHKTVTKNVATFDQNVAFFTWPFVVLGGCIAVLGLYRKARVEWKAEPAQSAPEQSTSELLG